MGILLQNNVRQTAQAIARHVLDALLAQDCLLCGQSSCGELLCRDCANDLPQLPAQRCPRCALPTPSEELCGRCLAHPPHYDRTLALFNYGFPLDKLIQAFKYAHRLSLGTYFGNLLAAAAATTDADLVIPLPLHSERLRKRGFNQALELARPVASARHLPIATRCCTRIRNTPAQANLSWREREKNIRGAFHCAEDLTGRRILLVDDVMTTGASLDECSRTLKMHGAVSVTLLVVARALP